jgi:hypothetical protein
MAPEKLPAILGTYHATGSQKATAQACEVNIKTVARLLHEARQVAKSGYPDMAVELA